MGAGRTEVMRALFGLDRYDGGSIFVKGQEVRIRSVQDAVRSGIAMLSEDRRRYGIVPLLSVEENIALAALDKFIRKGRWYKKEEFDAVRSMCEKNAGKTPALDTKVFSLSGGNQQKVILAKWMVRGARHPDPRRAYARHRCRSQERNLPADDGTCKAGKSIIMVSSELPELIGMCDRVYVMHEGYMTGMLEKDELSQGGCYAAGCKICAIEGVGAKQWKNKLHSIKERKISLANIASFLS